MESWQKDFISKTKIGLITNTRCNVTFLAELTARGVLSDQESKQLQSIKGENEKSDELYNILSTKVKGYEVLIEALEVQIQSGALKLLLQGMSEHIKHSTDVLVEDYTQKIHQIFFSELNETDLMLKQSQIVSQAVDDLGEELENFSINHKMNAIYLLKDRIQNVFFETKVFRQTLLSAKKDLLAKHNDDMRVFSQTCKSVDKFRELNQATVNEICKTYNKTLEKLDSVDQTTHLEDIRTDANVQYQQLEKTLASKLSENQTLDITVITEVVERYEEEMKTHIQRKIHMTVDELLKNHEKACYFAINRCSSTVPKNQQNGLKHTLDKYLKLYQTKNDMLLSQTEPAIGIDLGTVNSVVAVYSQGKVRIILNQASQKSTPSYVAFDDFGNLTAVGDSAKQNLVENPENTIYDTKRVIGRKMKAVQNLEAFQRWPFIIVNESGLPKYKVGEQLFEPERISALLLKRLVEDARKFLNYPVRKAVITVPAYFREDQKQATLEAGRLAGLDVLQLLPEPVAAGFTYKWERLQDTNKKVLIFDLGGGTFDVAVLKVEFGDVRVLASDGDADLGGNDIDERIIQYCLTSFKDQYKIDLLERKKTSNQQNALIAKGNLHRLYESCEKCKCQLSSTDNASVKVGSIADGHNLVVKLSRKTLEDLCKDLFDKMLTIVDKVLVSAKTEKRDIDEIILIGGATRTPKIQSRLQNHFQQKSLTYSINPDEAVAYGAAIKAAIKNGETPNDLLVKEIHDVVPMSIGVECVHNNQEGWFWAIILKNSVYPVEGKGKFVTFADNQEAVKIRVFQGDNDTVAENHFIGEYRLEGIPPGKKGSQNIHVTICYNENGVLEVTAECLSSGIKKKMAFGMSRTTLIVVKTNQIEP